MTNAVDKSNNNENVVSHLKESTDNKINGAAHYKSFRWSSSFEHVDAQAERYTTPALMSALRIIFYFEI